MGVMPKRDKTLTDFGRDIFRPRSDAGLSQDKQIDLTADERG
jgi:hypothetical protein